MAQPVESTTDHPTDAGPAASQIRDCGKQVHETRSQQRGPIGFEGHEAEAKYADRAQATGLACIGEYTAKQLPPNQWTKSPDHTNDEECLDDETCIERIEEERFIPSDRRCSDDDEDVSTCKQHNSHVTVRPPILSKENSASDVPNQTCGDQVNSGENYHTSDRMARQSSKDVKGVSDEKKTNKQVVEADQPHPPILLPPPSATMVVHVQPDKGDVVDGGKHTIYRKNYEWKKGKNIGSGGYGSCFHAQDVKHGTIMVVKQVKLTTTQSKEEQKKVINEVTIMAELKHHNNIVHCLGATQESGYLNIFLEWMPGESLQKLLKDFGPFSVLVITRYTKQIVTGVEFIHRCQIIHRDLKGDNILVDSTGHRVKIADFGLAVRVAEVDNKSQGTRPFMAPEVIREECYGTSADVWSVGCLIIQMATAKVPWSWGAVPLRNTDENQGAYIYKIGCVKKLTETVTEELGIDELTGEVKNFAICCMNPNPKYRPKAADLIKHALLQRV